METAASFEARFAPWSYPTITVDLTLLLSHVLCIWNSRDAPKII